MGTQESIDIAADICRRFEGFYSKPYRCPAGIWTIGYGTVLKPSGGYVKQTDAPIDEKTASEWLKTSLKEQYLPGILKVSPHLVQYPRVLGAILSFCYNLGCTRYRSSTLKRRINECNWGAAVTEILKWNKCNGKTLRGLVRRREYEGRIIKSEIRN